MSATFSPCGRFRYTLTREQPPTLYTDDKQPIVWVLLNPSTADATKDDPTLRRVVGFSEQMGFARVVVVNLFALRATDPSVLRVAPHRGDDSANDDAIAEAARHAGSIVCGWGANVRRSELAHRPAQVLALLRKAYALPVRAMRVLHDGIPEHPLFLPKATWPVKLE